MEARLTTAIAVLTALLALPAAAHGAGSWSCRASGGWISHDGQVVEPLVAGGGGACAAAAADTAAPARLTFTKPSARTSAGRPGATTDTQQPVAEVSADSVVIESPDSPLRVTGRALRAQAHGACSPSRTAGLSSSSGVRDVTVNGRPIPSDREFSEPGVGVNGAPLFGRLTVRFGELAAAGDAGSSSQRLVRRAVHVIVTDSSGAVVFEAVAGEVALGRDGSVCDPPPVCPEGQQLDATANRCVDVDVALPVPPVPVPPTPGAPGPGRPPAAGGCPDANARPGSASARELRLAVICVLNGQRTRRGLRRLRVNRELELAARRHARDMVVRRYFAHESPSGTGVVDRILRTRYLRRYGRWRIGEVLGWGWGAQGTPAAIVAGWMRSPSHRRQVLGRYTELGVGVQRAAPRRFARPATTFVVEFGTFAR